MVMLFPGLVLPVDALVSCRDNFLACLWGFPLFFSLMFTGGHIARFKIMCILLIPVCLALIL
ncbi:hypothetical protein OIU76_001360 [Salix suchowensis]|nr:hypothetical protein OIU76_001360 [Salix suchowensis]